jgi:cell division septation protein DedD
MKSESDYQLELFQHSGSYGNLKKRTGKPFFTYIRGHEKVVLIIIGILATSVISFALGVEKGKRVALASNNFAPPVKPAVTQEIPVNNVIPKNPATEPARPPVILKREMVRQLPAPNSSSGAYTVQLASFKKSIDAQKEAQILKNKGFITLVLTKGNYLVLCVGNFPNKETAKQQVLQLQKRYKDCYVRRL